MIHKVTIAASDPRWAVELKRKLNEMIDLLNNAAVRGDNTTARIAQGTVSAIPFLYPAKVTGAKSGDYYAGSVYLGGTESSSPLTGEKILFDDWDIDYTDTQGWLWVMPVGRDISGTDTRVWQVVSGEPKPPTSGNYALVSLDGVKQYVAMGPCTTTTTTTTTT